MVHVNINRVLWVDDIQESPEDDHSFNVKFDNGETLEVSDEEGIEIIAALENKYPNQVENKVNFNGDITKNSEKIMETLDELRKTFPNLFKLIEL